MANPTPDWPKEIKTTARKNAAALRALAASLPNVGASMFAHAARISDLATKNPSMQALVKKAAGAIDAAVQPATGTMSSPTPRKPNAAAARYNPAQRHDL